MYEQPIANSRYFKYLQSNKSGNNKYNIEEYRRS